jgi:ABC-type glycerol-3-phosphate transport system substrate-binding protein
MNEFIEKLKNDRTLQILLAGSLIMIFFVFYFIIKPLLFTSRPQQQQCYNVALTLWLPFKEEEINNYISDLSRFCIKFNIQKKSLDEIKNDLVLALASNQHPDIVFIDNEFLNKYPEFFTTPTPIFVDSLIAYYNQDILNFLNLQKPKTFDDLKNFIQKVKNYKQDFYLVGLGTKDVRNRKEIILSLMSLNEKFKDKRTIKQNLASALEIYKSFSNPQSDFFSYYEGLGDDLSNFANEKLALYLGFYSDKKEILSKNPRMNISFELYPLNNFPPKSKIYSKIFYLAPLKNAKNNSISQDFILWFKKYQAKKFAQDFDLVPFDGDDLPFEKQIIINSVKNFGETFDFLNKDVLFKNIDKLLEINGSELNRFIDTIFYSL